MQLASATPVPKALAAQTAASPAASRVVAEGRLAAYPGAEITIAAEVGGVLASVPFQERERVEKGDFIAQLKADDLIAEIAAAEAKVAETQAERGALAVPTPPRPAGSPAPPPAPEPEPEPEPAHRAVTER